MITFSHTYRSTQPEIMDNLNLKGKEMEMVLTDLKTVNKLLGGNKITVKGIARLLKGKPKSKTYTIIDIGCGDGEMLRQVAIYGEKQGWKFNLVGVDANAFILQEASNRSRAFTNISFSVVDILAKPVQLPSCDIVLCTLFLHHFKNEQISTIVSACFQVSKIGVVINDLQRSKIAFRLFKIFSYLFIKTKIARHDGLVSVARGFKKRDIVDISQSIKQEYALSPKWAFRWQWIFKK